MQTIRDKSGGIRFVHNDKDIQKKKELDRMSKIEKRLSIIEQTILNITTRLEKLESGDK